MASQDQWFNESLKRFAAGTLERYKVFDLGLSPQIGIKKVARAHFLMTQAVLRKIVTKHGISLASLQNLPSFLKDPLMAFNSSTDPASVIYLIDLKEGPDRLVVVAEFMKHPEFGVTHLVKSIHARPQAQLDYWTRCGLLLYQRK